MRLLSQPCFDGGTMAEDAKVVVSGITKPGIKTTEFWGSLLVHIAALCMIAFGTWKGSDGLANFGAILMGVTQGTYNLGRAYEKKGAMSEVPRRRKG